MADTDQLLDTERYGAYMCYVVSTAEHTAELQQRIRMASGTLIATNIHRARLQSGMSLDSLGDAIGGVTRQHLIKLEKAKHRPRAEMLLKIAAATDKPIDWFLTEEHDRPPFQEAA